MFAAPFQRHAAGRTTPVDPGKLPPYPPLCLDPFVRVQ